MAFVRFNLPFEIKPKVKLVRHPFFNGFFAQKFFACGGQNPSWNSGKSHLALGLATTIQKNAIFASIEFAMQEIDQYF